MRTINEVSKLTGLTVRTLHYYDEIGLLKPASVSEAGYRMYDDDNLERLHDIMLFRELEFSLKDIKKILSSPSFDRNKALNEQMNILILKRDHLNGLIEYIKRGEMGMSFKEFDKSKIEAYEKLAKEAWGDTEEYKEYEEKMAGKTYVEKRTADEKLMDIFFEFGEMKDKEPSDTVVQNQVKKLQDFITANYYTCRKEVLAGLGKMYKVPSEMKDNIDVAGGNGCAEFVAAAIEIYVK